MLFDDLSMSLWGLTNQYLLPVSREPSPVPGPHGPPRPPAPHCTWGRASLGGSLTSKPLCTFQTRYVRCAYSWSYCCISHFSLQHLSISCRDKLTQIEHTPSTIFRVISARRWLQDRFRPYTSPLGKGIRPVQLANPLLIPILMY